MERVVKKDKEEVFDWNKYEIFEGDKEEVYGWEWRYEVLMGDNKEVLDRNRF